MSFWSLKFNSRTRVALMAALRGGPHLVERGDLPHLEASEVYASPCKSSI